MSERRYKNPQVNLRLPDELKEKISKLAEKHKRSANAEMVAAIEHWVSEYEELEANHRTIDLLKSRPPFEANNPISAALKEFMDKVVPILENDIERLEKSEPKENTAISKKPT